MRLKSIFALAIAGIVLSGSSAKADDFTFSFTNLYGNTSGTVTGQILGITNNATSPAAQVILNSAPAFNFDFTPILPTLIATNWSVQGSNSFTEVGGVITAAQFDASTLELNATVGCGGQCFPLNNTDTLAFVTPGPNQFVPISASYSQSIHGGTIYGSVSFTLIPSSPVPEPGTLSLSLGGIAWLLRKRIRPAFR